MSAADAAQDTADNGSDGASANAVTNGQDSLFQKSGGSDQVSLSWDSFIAWINANGTDILIAIAIGILLFFIMLYARRTSRTLLEKIDPELDSGVSKIMARVIGKTSRLFMAVTAARLVVGNTSPPDAIYNLVVTLFAIVSAYQGAIWSRELILGAIEARRKTVDDDDAQSIKSAMTVIRLLVNVIVFTIATIVVFDNIGINVTGLMAGLGIGGIAIGLAAQGIFSDLFAALSILFDEPFKRGDTISYDDTKGKVKEIGLKTTRLQSENGDEKIISNAKLLDKEISNKSEREFRRELIIIRVIYQTSPELAERIPDILKQIVVSCKGTFSHAGFIDFNTSSIDYELEFFSATDGEEGFQIRHNVGLEIMKRFAKEGIKFAYPTQTTLLATEDGDIVTPAPKQAKTKPKSTTKGA